jgi:hypothetical protein
MPRVPSLMTAHEPLITPAHGNAHDWWIVMCVAGVWWVRLVPLRVPRTVAHLVVGEPCMFL